MDSAPVRRTQTSMAYRCDVCGALDERGPAANLFGADGHPRNIPRYSADMAAAWQIVEEMKRHGGNDWTCFVAFLRVQCQAGPSQQRLLAGPSVRSIAVAAGQVIGVVDA